MSTTLSSRPVHERFVIYPQIDSFSREEKPGRQFEHLVTGLLSPGRAEDLPQVVQSDGGLISALWQVMNRQPVPYPIQFDNYSKLLLTRKQSGESKGFLALDLYWEVLKALKRGVHKRQLRLCYAISALVDFRYGVDLFFRCQGRVNIAITTIDLSQQYKSPQELKANFNLTEKEFEVGRLPVIAGEIARHLEAQLTS